MEAVVATLHHGIPVARMELLDDVQMAACIAYSRLNDLAPLPTLSFELHGSPGAVEADLEQVRLVCEQTGGRGFRVATSHEERNRLWRARHDAYWAARQLAPGKEGIATDAWVPISKLPEIIQLARHEAAKRQLVAPIVGHWATATSTC